MVDGGDLESPDALERTEVVEQDLPRYPGQQHQEVLTQRGGNTGECTQERRERREVDTSVRSRKCRYPSTPSRVALRTTKRSAPSANAHAIDEGSALRTKNTTRM